MTSELQTPTSFIACINENIVFFRYETLSYVRRIFGFFRKRTPAIELAEFLEKTDASFVYCYSDWLPFTKERLFFLSVSYYDDNDVDDDGYYVQKDISFTMRDYSFDIFWRLYRMQSDEPPSLNKIKEVKKLCWKKFGF